MKTGNLYDPNLHLFLDDAEVQDHPGFVRKVQQPERVGDGPVLSPDRPWEGKAVQMWGGALYDDEEDLFKMWYYAVNMELYNRDRTGMYICYATSKDAVTWDKPELGICESEGSTANNIVYPPPGCTDLGADPWGVVKDEHTEDPQKRYKMMVYQQRPTPDAPVFDEVGMTREEKNEARKHLLRVIKDHLGGYPVFSPDGLHWTDGEDICVPRAGDGGTLVYDPMKRRYIATSRRYGTVLDHFVIEWKKYRRVISVCTSENFVDWSAQKTVIKPDDFDDPLDQFYVMTPCVYGNQYIGFLGPQEGATELGPTQLVSSRDLEHWERVGKREEFLPVGPSGGFDGAWATIAPSSPVLVDDTLYLWYNGRPQAHGTEGMFESYIGAVKLRKDRFVALRCGIRGAEMMTEPVTVGGAKLFLNATALFGDVRVRVVDDYTVPEGFEFDDCNGLDHDDLTSCEITWGADRRDLSQFAGRQVRLHIRSSNATSLFSYRFTDS